MSGGMAASEEELPEEVEFQFEPDKSNEENCQKILELLHDRAYDIGKEATDDGDKLELADRIMEAVEVTAERFVRERVQDKTVAIIGDQGQGKSTLINLMLLLTELDESQYGLVPAFGTQESGVLPASTRSQRGNKPKKEDWEATIFAIPYLREVMTQALKPPGTAGLKVKKQQEFKKKIEEIVQQALNNVVLPRLPVCKCDAEVCLEKHRSDDDMKRESDIMQKTIDACNTFPSGKTKHDTVHEHLLRACNAGDSTSFTLTKLMWGPTYCALIRTKSEKQLIDEIKEYPFEQNLNLYEAGELDDGGSKLLLDMCAKLRVSAGHDYGDVETNEYIDRETLPSFTDVQICDEIRERAGKNIIIAGHGFHKEHDRVFVRQEITKYIKKSISVIVEEVVFFAPSVLLKKGLILIDPPGTVDKSPLNRAVTRDAVQKADLLVLLSRATIQQGGAFDFLKEAHYLERVLYSPKTCKVLMLSTLDEQKRKLTAAEILETWDDKEEDLYEARAAVLVKKMSVKRFESTLRSEHAAILKGRATCFDAYPDEDGSADPKQASKLLPFKELYGQIENEVEDRNLVFLPVAYTSLSLHKGEVVGMGTKDGHSSQKDRETVLERTGGAKVLEQLLNMVEDKSKDRMEELLKRLDELKKDSLPNDPTESQEEVALSAAFRDVFVRESKRKWFIQNETADRDNFLKNYENRMKNLQKFKVNSMLDEFEERIFKAVGGHEEEIMDIKNRAIAFLNKRKAKDLMKVLVKGSFARSKVHDIVFGGMRLQQNIVHEEATGFVKEIKDAFKEEFSRFLIEKAEDNMKGRNGPGLRSAILSPEDKENISNHVTKWCQKEFNSSSFLKSGTSVFNKVLKNVTFTEWLNAACKDSSEDLLTEAKAIIDKTEGLPSVKPAQWTKMGNDLKELFKGRVEDMYKDARRQFAQQVRDDFSERAEKFVQYFLAGRKRTKRDGATKESIERLLSVYTACNKALEKKCARSQDEVQEDTQAIARAKERQDNIIKVLSAFSESITDQLISAEIERQQLMRWIRSQSLGLPSIMLQPNRPKKFTKGLRDQLMRTPLKYCDDQLAFRRVLDVMKEDNIVPQPLDLSFEGSATLCLFKDPVVPDDGDSLIRVMIQAVTDIESPSAEQIKSMRHRLVSNTIADCSSKEAFGNLFKELSGESVGEWGNRMKTNGVPGDVFVIESFCNYYKVNVLLITKLSEHHNVCFPAFRMEGGSHPQQNIICFVRFDGGVFCLVRPRLRIGGTSSKTYNMDVQDSVDRKRHWRQTKDRVAESKANHAEELRREGGSPARPTKMARQAAAQTPPHPSTGSSGSREYSCPPGSFVHFSRSNGRKYFYDPTTGKSIWADEPPPG